MLPDDDQRGEDAVKGILQQICDGLMAGPINGDFVFKMMNSAFKMMKFVLKMMMFLH